ncbi:MAG TPA: transporter substrate-binding domain-containing protein [Longimicrobiales bacterium]|nr:transporter substrate-binding domain-containing protein [Longimicrobiales bacterium]
MNSAGLRALSLAGVFILACTPQDATDSTLERSRQHGLRVGLAIEPPYAYVDSTGEPTGSEPGVLMEMARDLGITELQWFPLPFHDLIPGLLAGRVDVIASGLFITPERKQLVRFSQPTLCVGSVLVTRRASAAHASREPGEATCPACRIATVQGSVEHRSFAHHGPDRELVVVPDLATAAAAVHNGTADALAISAPTGRRMAEKDSALSVDDRSLPRSLQNDMKGCAALAFRPQDDQLAAAFDSVLAEFVGTSGHLELVEPFGFRPHEVPCGSGIAVQQVPGCSRTPASADHDGQPERRG